MSEPTKPEGQHASGSSGSGDPANKFISVVPTVTQVAIPTTTYSGGSITGTVVNTYTALFKPII